MRSAAGPGRGRSRVLVLVVVQQGPAPSGKAGWAGKKQGWGRRESGSGSGGGTGGVVNRGGAGTAGARPGQGWSLELGGADFSPRHSVARGPARKPGPHTQWKLPGVFSQRPGAQGGGMRRHSSTSEGKDGLVRG